MHDIVCTHLPYCGHRIPDRLTMVTGFLFVIFYRNQLQRSSSQETLCAREVHRMVLGGLNVQILHQKKLCTSCTCSSETKQNVCNLVYLVSKLCEFWFTTVGFEPWTSRSTSGDVNNLQRHFPCLQEIWNSYQKKQFPRNLKTRRNFGNPNVKHNILHFTTRVFGHQPPTQEWSNRTVAEHMCGKM